jgi:hypothetical protein
MSCLSLLIPKLMVIGVSQCFPAMNMLYVGQFNPLNYSSLPFPSHPRYSAAFSTYHYVLYLHRCELFWFCWLSLSFPFPPPPISIVYSTISNILYLRCVYEHICFCVYIYLSDLFLNSASHKVSGCGQNVNKFIARM